MSSYLTINPATRIQWNSIHDILSDCNCWNDTFRHLGQYFIVRECPSVQAKMTTYLQDWIKDLHLYTGAWLSLNPTFDDDALFVLVREPLPADEPQIITLRSCKVSAFPIEPDSRICCPVLIIDEFDLNGGIESGFFGYDVYPHVFDGIGGWIKDSLDCSDKLGDEIVESLVSSSRGYEHGVGANVFYGQIDNSYTQASLGMFYSNLQVKLPPLLQGGYTNLPGLSGIMPSFIHRRSLPNKRFKGQQAIHFDELGKIGNFEDVMPNHVHIGCRRTDAYPLLGPMLQTSLLSPFVGALSFHKEHIEPEVLLQLFIARKNLARAPDLLKWKNEYRHWLNMQFSNLDFFTPEFEDLVVNHTELNTSFDHTFEARTRIHRNAISQDSLQEHTKLHLERFERGYNFLHVTTDPRESYLKDATAQARIKGSLKSRLAIAIEVVFQFCRIVPLEEFAQYVECTPLFDARGVTKNKIFAALQELGPSFAKSDGISLTWAKRRSVIAASDDIVITERDVRDDDNYD